MGGSILSHDHFQGGAHEFPMMHAAEVSQFSVPGFDQVSGTVLQWPLSVLRLRSHDRAQLLDAAEKIILAWREWTDESVGIIAHTADGVAHNTVTPVIRRVDSAATPAAKSTRPTWRFAATSRPMSIRWAYSTRMPSTTTLRRRTSA